MEFLEAKKQAIECLKLGKYFCEDREGIGDKNFLAVGKVSEEFVIAELKKCIGTNHEKKRLHQNSKFFVHIFKTKEWYIKLYFNQPNCIIISVHKHEKKNLH